MAACDAGPALLPSGSAAGAVNTHLTLHVVVPDVEAAQAALEAVPAADVLPYAAQDTAGRFPSGGFLALDATGYALHVSGGR